MKKAVLLSNQTLSFDRRSKGKTTVIRCAAISSLGVIAYCTVTKYTNRDWYSLYIDDHGSWQTVIFEAQDIITGLLFQRIGGRERLLMVDQPNIVMMDEQLTSSERTLIELHHDTPLCSAGNDKVLYVQRTDACGWEQRGRVPGDWELWELKVTTTSEACPTTKLGLLQLGWKYVSDMCTAGNLLILCSHKDKGVAAVSFDDWQVKWKVTEVKVLSVCPGTKGTVFAACPDSDPLQQLSLHDGSFVPQDTLKAGSPWSLQNHDSNLFVVNYIDDKLLSDVDPAGQKKHWEVQQYKLNPSKPWLLHRKIINAFDDDAPIEPQFQSPTSGIQEEYTFSKPYPEIPLTSKEKDPFWSTRSSSPGMAHGTSTNSRWVKRWLMRPERHVSSGLRSSSNDGRGSDSRFK